MVEHINNGREDCQDKRCVCGRSTARTLPVCVTILVPRELPVSTLREVPWHSWKIGFVADLDNEAHPDVRVEFYVTVQEPETWNRGRCLAHVHVHVRMYTVCV